MYLACKMKLNIRVIADLGIQEPFALSQVHRVPVFVFAGVSQLKFCKVI
jgi:hypothetical protein